MRLLLSFVGLLIAIGAPLRLHAAERLSLASQSMQASLADARVLTGDSRLRPQGADPTSPLDRTISLALDRVRLKDALDEVARRADVRIAYSGRVVPLDKRVTAHLDGVRVHVALNSLLRGTGAVPMLEPTGQILLVTDLPARRLETAAGSITGTVRSAQAATPLEGATVTVLGTRFGAVTRPGGQYAIADVPAGTYRLRARRLGYTVAETSAVVPEGGQVVVDFQLQAVARQLDEVVTIGYGTTTKRDATGAMVNLTADDLKTDAVPTVTLTSALQGKAAGVQVVSNTGMPGGGLRVRVRGTGSITANSEPLYVIDGLPAVQGTSESDPKVNPLMSVDPNEIESVEILKDASATAIYGARGANGVVLITTKRGQRGESRLALETSYGQQKISKTIPVLNAQEFMQFVNEARINANRTPGAIYTSAQIANAQTYDYPGMMLRTAPQMTHALSLSGGDLRMRYLLSGNYTQQDGIELGSDFKRYGIRLNVDSDVNTRFRVGTSMSLTRVERNAAAVENGALGNSANGIQAALQFDPSLAPRDSLGNWVKSAATSEPTPNPVANATELIDLNTTSRLLGNGYAELDITPSVRLRTTLGGNFQFDKINFFAPRTIQPGGPGGSGWMFSREIRDLTNENTVNYRRDQLGPGSLDLLGGFSVQTFHSDDVRGNAANFPTDATTVFALGSGAQLQAPESGVTEAALLSYLGRANYNIAGKYLFTLTGRYDGSSRFGRNNKWAFFPSGAFAWRVSEENFMAARRSTMSDLKLRLSYGQVGNQAVDPYQSLARLNTQWYAFAGTEFPALAPGNAMPNPNLKWEKQKQLNVGVDAAFLNDRLTLSLDGYNSTTEDLLLSVTIPSTTGFTSQLRNIGSVRNRGLELSLNTVNFENERFSWRSSLSIAGNRNKVVNLGTALNSAGEQVPLTQILITARGGGFLANDTHIIRVGEPLGAIFGYQVIGLWQPSDTVLQPGGTRICHLKNRAECTPGEYRIADVNGDSVINATDRQILGYGDPKFYGGFNNTVTYGPFSLDASITFVSGNKILNAGNAYGALAKGELNERKTVLDRWTPQNTNTLIPRANLNRTRAVYSTLVEDGSYVRLQSITLGYAIPTRFMRGAESARVFVTGQNLWISTDYSGFDPDVNSMGGDARFGGTDIGAYPRTKSWNVGVAVTF
jgi:TonB-linked SusC/RagA family outer membrane protein